MRCALECPKHRNYDAGPAEICMFAMHHLMYLLAALTHSYCIPKFSILPARLKCSSAERHPVAFGVRIGEEIHVHLARGIWF